MKRILFTIAAVTILFSCQEKSKMAFVDTSKVINEYQEKIDIEEKFSIEHKKILGQYNFETTTGRPTNNFNGINFSALKKDNGERGCFEASNDFFVEVDYELIENHLNNKIILILTCKGCTMLEISGNKLF